MELTKKDELTLKNYLILKNFITKERAEAFYTFFKKDADMFPELFIKDNQCPKSLAYYDWHYFIELLVEKSNELSSLLQEPLLPTYTYARVYANGEELKPHMDRPSCEISVTCHLGGDGTPWEIYLTTPQYKEVSIILEPGDAILYLGCISNHFRKPFEGQHYGQVFLHYVKSRGENWLNYFDKRGILAKEQILACKEG